MNGPVSGVTLPGLHGTALNTPFLIPHLPALSPGIPLPSGLLTRIASSATFAFDVDDTLNAGRGKEITEEAAELVYKFVLLGKRIAIISGRTFDEFQEINTLEPLLRRMRERNIQSEIVVYAAGGGEKVFVKADGTFRHDLEYSRPYSELESREIVTAIRQKDAELNRKHGLRAQGIEPYCLEYRGIAYQWSPYGKADPRQYDFESNPEGQSENPPRLTRKVLGEEVTARLHAAGLEDIESVVSGKTTTGFCRKGISKQKSMLDLLKSGSVTYFGDEVSRDGDKTGNDNIIGEMAAAHDDKLTVISVDKKMAELPPSVVYIGGCVEGTKWALLETFRFSEDESRSNDLHIQTARKVLSNYDLGAIRDIRPLSAGEGIHSPYYEVVAEKGHFVLRHVREDLFPNTLGAARAEVFVVNKFRERKIPFAEIMPLANAEAARPEDRHIAVGPDRTYHLLYRFVPGEVGNFATMNDNRFGEMVRMLARMHRALNDGPLPYPREYFQPNLLDISRKIPLLKELRAVVASKKAANPNYCYSRGERLVLENADFIAEQLDAAVNNLKPVWSVLPRVPIHSDFQPPNVIFNGDKIAGIIDLEHMRVEPRLYDLAPLTRLGTDKGIFHLENARRVVVTYNNENKLTTEEIEALPEIFRLKLLDRVCRLVNPARHFEGRGFDYNGTPECERSISLIDHNDRLFVWYQNLITSLRDLDVRVAHGDFRRVIQDKIDGEKRTSEELREEFVRNLRSKRLSHEISISPLREFDLTSAVERARPVEKVAESEPGRWRQSGNVFHPCRRNEYGWCQLRIGDRVIFNSGKVIVYQAPGRDIHIQIRGNDMDSVKHNTEMAHIVIVLDGHQRAREVRMLPRCDRDLSRSSMAIQLTDSGLFDEFPAIQKLLRYQLVWQDVDGGLRHREILDAHEIRLDLLAHAEHRPNEITGEQLSGLIHFSYFKSKVIRQMAFDVIGRVFDSGRISRSEYMKNMNRFMSDDIAEDFRVIERGLKNDPGFLRELSRNLFQTETGRSALSGVSLEYVDQKRSKSIYRAVFKMKDGRQEQAAISLMRHDPINVGSGLKMSEIERAVDVWRALSTKVPGIPTFGGHTRETDYRGKDLVTGPNTKQIFVNNIVVCAYRFVPGMSLHELLTDKEMPLETKRDAIDVCLQTARQIYEQSLALTGKGYFMERPEAYKFIVNDSNGALRVSITDPQRLLQYPSLEMVDRRFETALRKYAAHLTSGPD